MLMGNREFQRLFLALNILIDDTIVHRKSRIKNCSRDLTVDGTPLIESTSKHSHYWEELSPADQCIALGTQIIWLGGLDIGIIDLINAQSP